MAITQAHEEKYEAMCRKFGVRWDEESPCLVNETVDSLRDKYREDPHLNNIPRKFWDGLAIGMHAPGTTLCERVCMQKHAARRLLKETNPCCNP